MVSVGTIVWLSSELMFFAGLFAIYFTARAQTAGRVAAAAHRAGRALRARLHDHPGGVVVHLPVRGVRRGAGRRVRAAPLVPAHARHGPDLRARPGQRVPRTWSHEGTTISSAAYGTVFYLTTGFHGLHVIGGLIAFVFLIIRTKISKFTPAQATAAIVVSYYWHFVDVVWIGLFAMIYFIR